MKSLRDEIPLTRGYGEADLISSEALAEDFIQTRLDFILQSRISFLLLFQIRFHFNSSVFNFVSFSPITRKKRKGRLVRPFLLFDKLDMGVELARALCARIRCDVLI